MDLIVSGFKFLFHIVMAVLLTAITQIGGAIYLAVVIVYKTLGIKKKRWKVGLFSLVYLLITLFVIPPIAKKNNRVPLPFFKSAKHHVKPQTVFTSLANRHYVRPELKSMIFEVAEQANQKYPGLDVRYLDGNFPLFEKFRMLPHLRHDNGKKLDVSFIYKDKKQKYTGRYFSFFGYGFSAKPTGTEQNLPAQCAAQGRWQYNIIEKVVPDQNGRELEFAKAENAFLIKKIVSHPNTGKVFIEPHLKTRLGLSGFNQIRFHGCWAVRHDDHMHIQM